MGWLEFLTSLPTLLSTAMQMEKLFIDFVHEKDLAAKRQQFVEALQDARATKDSTKLEAFMRNLVNGTP